MGQRCTLAADVYSFGVLLIELTTQPEVSQRIQWRMPRAPDECPQAVLELITDCMLPDPALRPSAAQALRRLRQANDAG